MKRTRYNHSRRPRKKLSTPNISFTIEKDFHPEAWKGLIPSLDDNQVKVLKLVALGYMDKEIAGELQLDLSDVQTLIKQLRIDLRLKHRTQLAVAGFITYFYDTDQFQKGWEQGYSAACESEESGPR